MTIAQLELFLDDIKRTDGYYADARVTVRIGNRIHGIHDVWPVYIKRERGEGPDELQIDCNLSSTENNS